MAAKNRGAGDDNKNQEMDHGHDQQIPPEAAFTSPQPIQDPVFISLTKDDLIELLREARRDPKVEARVEEEAMRVEQRRQQMVRIAKQDEMAKIMRQKRCRHRKPNGEEASGGQEFSDGRIRIFCLRCQKTLRSYYSPQVAQGMALRQRMQALGMTDADIKDSMQFEGEGDPFQDSARANDDFALGVPRGVSVNDLTTENLYE